MAQTLPSGGTDRHSYVDQWFVAGHIPDLSVRSAQQSYLPPRATIHNHGNHGTSMMMSGNESLAGLSSGPTRSSGSSSFRSGAARSPSEQRLLEQDPFGVLQPRPIAGPLQYDCYMPFLGCDEVFRNSSEWKKHCFDHFEGAGPPTINKCCFCDAKHTAHSNTQNWNDLMEHLETIHFRLGVRVRRTARPDFDLCRYFLQRKIITNQDWKDIQGTEESRASSGGVLPATRTPEDTGQSNTRSGPVTVTNDNRRRRERRPGPL